MTSATTGGLTGIVAALREEIRPLEKRLEKPMRLRVRGIRGLKGRLGDREVVVMATGDGGERARQGMSDLLSAFDLEAVIAIGIAGGLSSDLEVGAVVAAERITNGTGEVPPPDAGLLAKALVGADVRGGAVYSHSEIAVDPVAKQRLWQKVGGGVALVVDLESASYARAAASHAVPYLVIRAVSDSRDEALPLDFNRYRKPDGSSDRARIGRHALMHPSIVPELMQLRDRLRHCAGRLAGLVEEILSR